MKRPETPAGRELYALLPEVYRNRDRDSLGGGGDLAAYLDACGELLDLVRDTLDQRRADSFPDRPPGGRAVQGWLLPYVAQLLDVRLISPHADGRRQETARAVSWRQRKGTLAAVEEIAEAVAQTEVEVREGWKRVATTPRVGLPLEPAPELERPLDMTNPLKATCHPSLPAVTPDLRRAAAAPGSHRDAVRRTVDVRAPTWRHGHHHPRRLLLYAPPPAGFFPPDRVILDWGERHRPEHQGHVRDLVENGVRRIFNPHPLWDVEEERERPEGAAVCVKTRPPNFTGERTVVADLAFLDTLTVDGGRLELAGVAARRVVVKTAGGEAPVLDARDCLFGSIEAAGLVRLEYCTVLGDLAAGRLQASDCLFAGGVEITGPGEQEASCVRYSRIPPPLAALPDRRLRRGATTTEEPVFYDFELRDAEGAPRRSTEFGMPACGVLHPSAPELICFGAEDGGEMGAFHRRRYCLGRAAVLDKLEDFLPVGIEAALVPDPGLLNRGGP